jgi:hypothetical protein
MSYVNISDVKILKNDVPFMAPFEFEITFECLSELKDGILQSRFPFPSCHWRQWTSHTQEGRSSS